MSYDNSCSVIGFRAARARKESGRTYEESNCHGKSCLKGIRGYHVYNKTWEAVVREALVHVRKIARKRFRSINCSCCERGIVIGHLPRKLSRVCSLFLRRGGTINVQ